MQKKLNIYYDNIQNKIFIRFKIRPPIFILNLIKENQFEYELRNNIWVATANSSNKHFVKNVVIHYFGRSKVDIYIKKEDVSPDEQNLDIKKQLKKSKSSYIHKQKKESRLENKQIETNKKNQHINQSIKSIKKDCKYNIGAKVNHNIFGIGKIIDNKDAIVVEFKNNRNIKFNLDTCKEEKVL